MPTPNNTVVWKFPLDLVEEQTIHVPHGAVALHCELQGRQPCLWVQVDPTVEKTPRRIILVGTGNSHPALAEPTTVHIGTVQMDEFVWHFFEVGGGR